MDKICIVRQMSEIVEFAILALATWRLTSLFYIENGPAKIFAHLRGLAGVYYVDGERRAKNELAELLNCPDCLSIWFGALVALSYLVSENFTWLWLPFALSTVSILIEKVVSYGKS